MDYFFCVDNDITPNLNAIVEFLQESFIAQADLSWGRIGIRSTTGLVTQMIKIDKMLSHSIIRPLLWKSGWGASLPGQVFLIKVNTFRDKLPKPDTVFDDLTIGICARENNCNVYFNKSILGWEKPKETIVSLLYQRIRWAKGFSQVLNINRRLSGRLHLVLAHGIAYHLLWPIFWGLIYIASFIAIEYGIFVWLILAGILTFGRASLIPAALIYTIAFSAIHTIWLIIVFYNCILELVRK
jgi:cellulose synthase/poly-beta-1,6-N-acetylglucosamine synthase-like glycosyltransferase